MTELTRVASIIGLVGLYTLAAWGWGSLVARACALRELRWPLAVAVGVAAWIFLGGVLNLLRLAFPWALDAIVLAGWALALVALRTRRRAWAAQPARQRGALVAVALPWALVAGIGVFVAATLVPPTAYNLHDDFLTYFAHPVRMLATGTVFGSPLSEIGRLALGGQAFLDGFLLAHFPIAYVNAVDALFCFLLLLAVLVAFATRSGPAPVAASLAVALAVAINPQTVNISALFSGSALSAAAMLIAIDSVPRDGVGAARRLAPVSLLCAALVALKPTFLPFAVLQLGFLAVAEGLARRSLRAFAASGLWLLGTWAVFLAPWLALHAPHYLRARAVASAAGHATFAPLAPFDISPLAYGDTVLHYTLAFAIPALVGAGLVAVRRRGPEDARGAAHVAAATCLGAVATYLVFLFTPAMLDASPERIVRFLCPLALAAAPAALLLGWSELAELAPGDWRRAVRPTLVAVTVAGVALFAPGLWTRIGQAAEDGSVLAFRASTSAPYLDYSATVLAGGYRDRVADLQARVPAGAPLLAWIATPFHLDFARNAVFDVDVAGLANPWASTPPVRWVLWSYRGFAVRSIASCRGMDGTPADVLAGERCAELQLKLTELATTGRAEVVADDGEMVLFELAEPLED